MWNDPFHFTASYTPSACVCNNFIFSTLNRKEEIVIVQSPSTHRLDKTFKRHIRTIVMCFNVYQNVTTMQPLKTIALYVCHVGTTKVQKSLVCRSSNTHRRKRISFSVVSTHISYFYCNQMFSKYSSVSRASDAIRQCHTLLSHGLLT